MSNAGFNFNQRPKGRTPVRKNPPFQASQANFNSLFGITGQGVGVRRNNKFMRNDYYNQVILPKNPDWQRTVNRDWDNDGRNDIVIHDPQGNIKYFNGYSLYKVPQSHYGYQNYLINNPSRGESIKSYKEVENPTKFILNQAVSTINKWVNEQLKTMPNSKALIAAKDQYKFKDRLKSIIKRYALLPYAYELLGYDPEEVKTLPTQTKSGKPINDIKQAILQLYAKKGVRKAIKDGGYTALPTILNILEQGIRNGIKNNVQGFVEGVVNENIPDFAEALFDNAIGLANNVKNELGMPEEEVEEELDV
jgi:hypothetical protein